MKKQKIRVYDEDFCRIDVWLHRNFPEISRSAFIRLIKRGMIQKNQKIINKPSQVTRLGDVLEITWPSATKGSLVSENIPLDIIYQDDAIVVVNKRAGIIVHPSCPFQKGTLVNGLLYAGISLASYGAPLRPGIVHRLDRDTSGVMVIAKTDQAYLELIRMFKNREVEKCYLALVEGRWEGKAVVDLAIRRSRHSPCLMEVSRLSGKSASTEVEPKIVGMRYSLLEVRPHTGRTHQIRVHLSHQGYPIVGDTRYGSRYSEKVINHQALHAFLLSFFHPITHKKMTFAGALPVDFRDALNVISNSSNIIRDLRNHQ